MTHNNKLIHLKVDLDDDNQKIQKYIEYHGNVWPEVIEDLKERGVDRMRIFISGNRLNMILEVPKDFQLNDGIHQTPPNEKVAEWSKLMTSYSKTNKDGSLDSWQPTELIFDTEDYI